MDIDSGRIISAPTGERIATGANALAMTKGRTRVRVGRVVEGADPYI